MSRFPKARLLRRVIGGVALAAALVACGGGTEQKDPFDPGRLIVFGDENSLLDGDGRRWSINQVDAGDAGAAATLNCAGNPIWVQRVASHYGFVFAECNPDPDGKEVKAFFRSQAGSGVDGVEDQIAAQVTEGGFRDGDLVTVASGANDVLALYGQYTSRPRDQLLRDAASAGARLGRSVERLAGLGARVLVTSLPNLGRTPFALAEQAGHTDVDRAALLSALTTAFNDGYGELKTDNGLVSVVGRLSGRNVGYVDTYTRLETMARYKGSFNLADVEKVACTAALPGCSSQTLVTGATSSNYLWADATHFGPRAHEDFAERAIDRAEDNPF